MHGAGLHKSPAPCFVLRSRQAQEGHQRALKRAEMAARGKSAGRGALRIDIPEPVAVHNRSDYNRCTFSVEGLLLSTEEKPDPSGVSQNTEKPRKGIMSIPKGELEDMERERRRVARKPRPKTPQTPKD